MINLSLSGLGVIKRSQDGVVNDRPRRQSWKTAENELNGEMIMTKQYSNVWEFFYNIASF